MSATSDVNLFDNWMKKMKTAWEEKDPQAAADLCSRSGFKYYEDIFKPPLTTKAEIKKIWLDVPKDQSAIDFKYEILQTTTEWNYAHWRVKFFSKKANEKISLDGIFMVKLDIEGFCKEFKQWWIKK